MHAVYLPSSGSPHFSSTHLLLGLCTPKSSHLKLANPRAGLFVDRKGNRALESLRPHCHEKRERMVLSAPHLPSGEDTD